MRYPVARRVPATTAPAGAPAGRRTSAVVTPCAADSDQRGRVAVVAGQAAFDVVEADPTGAGVGIGAERRSGVAHGQHQHLAAARRVEPGLDPDVAAADRAGDAVLDGVLDQRLQQQARHRQRRAAPAARR